MAYKNNERGKMTVGEAGHEGGQKVKKLVEEGKERLQEGFRGESGESDREDYGGDNMGDEDEM